MQQIIKLMDVPANKIGALHEVLELPLFKRTSVDKWHSDKEVKIHHHVLGQIVSAQSKNGQTYTVEIKMEPVYSAKPDAAGREPSRYVYPSIELLQAIYDVLDIYPKEERIEKS